MTTANPVVSLAANLGAFMLNGADIKPMPCGVVDGQASFSNPGITSILDGNEYIRTVKWKPCEIDPLINIKGDGGSGLVEMDRGTAAFEAWNDADLRLRRLSGVAGNQPAKIINNRASKFGETAALAMVKVDKFGMKIAASDRLAKSMEASAAQISWRAVRGGVAVTSSVEDDRVALNRHYEAAAEGFVSSGILYALGNDNYMAAEKLKLATDCFRSIGKHDSSAMWAEVIARLVSEYRGEMSRFAANSWLNAAKERIGEGDVTFELSRALQNSWLAKHWVGYSESMDVLRGLHEGQDDYSGVAADYVRQAWALLQHKRLSNAHRKDVVDALDNAQVAWELVGEDGLSASVGVFAATARGVKSS